MDDHPKVRRVEIWLQENSTPTIREWVECYTKGHMYCTFNRDDNYTEKTPLCNIFRVVEYY